MSNRGLMGGGGPPPQNPHPGALAPQGRPPAEPPGSERPPHPGDYRRAIHEMEERLSGALGELMELLRSGQIGPQDLARPRADGRVMGPGLGNCFPHAHLQHDFAVALREGCCVPYFLPIDSFAPAGRVGLIQGAAFVENSIGPFAVADIIEFARVDPLDPKAAEFALGLFEPPVLSCPDPFASQCPPQMQFVCDDGKLLFPHIDVRGSSVPVGSVNDEAFDCCGFHECQVNVKDQNGVVDSSFKALRPVIIPTKAEAFNADVEFFTDTIPWQYAPVPADVFGGRGWTITERKPDCMGFCGLLRCGEQITVIHDVLRAPRFGLEVRTVLAGFRVVHCGNLCGTC